MQFIGGASGTVAANPDLKLLFKVIEHYPWLVLIGTALFTVAVQSSTASIGLGIGLAQGGLLPQATIIPWVLGANLGVALTAMMAGWGSMEGRRLAVGNLLLKSVGALAVLLGGSYISTAIFRLLPGAIGHQAANFNTFFNLALGLLAVPLLTPISHLLVFLIEAPESAEPGGQQSYLDPSLLQTPSLALNQSTREELRIVDELKLMLRAVWMMLFGKNLRILANTEEHQRHVEEIEEGLKDYLGQIGDENLSEDDVRWKFVLLDFAQELEAIGTLVRRDLADAVIHQIKAEKELSSEDQPELEALYSTTLARMEKATQLLMSRDSLQAAQFVREKEEINSQCRVSRKARYEKLPGAQAVSANFLDMVTCLRRINSHLTAIGYALARPAEAGTVVQVPGDDFETDEGLRASQ
jgi:phosphate:Na+ symporter